MEQDDTEDKDLSDAEFNSEDEDDDIDLDTGRRVWDTPEDIETRKQELAQRSLATKIFDTFC